MDDGGLEPRRAECDRRIPDQSLAEGIADGGVDHDGVRHVRLEASLERPRRRLRNRVAHRELRLGYELDVPQHFGAAHRIRERQAEWPGWTELASVTREVIDTKCPVGVERPARRRAHRLLFHLRGRHQLTGAPPRERALRHEQHHTSQRIGRPISLPTAGLAEPPRVVVADATLGGRTQPNDALAAARGAELHVRGGRELREVDRPAVDEVEPLVRSDVPGALLAVHRATEEEPRPLDAEGESMWLGESAPVHGAEAVRDGHRVACAGGERLGRPQADGDRVAPLESPAHRGLDAEDRRRIDGAVERPGDGAVERDGDLGGGNGVTGRRGAGDAERRGALCVRVRGQRRRQDGEGEHEANGEHRFSRRARRDNTPLPGKASTASITDLPCRGHLARRTDPRAQPENRHRKGRIQHHSRERPAGETSPRSAAEAERPRLPRMNARRNTGLARHGSLDH